VDEHASWDDTHVSRFPAVFLAHGAPTIALEDTEVTRAYRRFGERLHDARAVVVVSAHWQTRATARVNAVARPELIYDFGGFPDELYRVRYDAPGDPVLARDVAKLLEVALEEKRGWDHGVWTPLVHLLPEAKTPIVELSLPYSAAPEDLLAIGAKLSPLRDDGVAIIGSGVIVHNLGMARLDDRDAPPDAWATAFDDWVAERVAARDFETLAAYASLRSEARLAVPTPEHFEPLFVVCGASFPDDRYEEIAHGMEFGNLSMRSMAFG
jgi:4,5-DOPA dioxygenase extradiol